MVDVPPNERHRNVINENPPWSTSSRSTSTVVVAAAAAAAAAAASPGIDSTVGGHIIINHSPLVMQVWRR